MIKVHVSGDGTNRIQVTGARIRGKSVKVCVGTFATQRDVATADEQHRVTQRAIKAGEFSPVVSKRFMEDALDAWLRAIAGHRSEDHEAELTRPSHQSFCLVTATC